MRTPTEVINSGKISVDFLWNLSGALETVLFQNERLRKENESQKEEISALKSEVAALMSQMSDLMDSGLPVKTCCGGH